MLKVIILFIFMFFIYDFSYWYNFNWNTFYNYLWEKNYEKSYVIDNIKFMVQAPYANWSKHNESCEEAALFLSHYNINNLYFDKHVADQELDKINYYEENDIWIIKDKYHNKYSDTAYLRDIDIEQLQNLAKWFYWYNDKNSHTINNVSIEMLKYLISKDYILIIPSDTKTLWNPNFNQSTNSFHVIDLVWYDDKNFITFDPGTSLWAYYEYSYDVIIEWLRKNWDIIFILEGEKNFGRIDFQNINNEITFDKKINLILSKVDNVLIKNSNNEELILKKILDNLDKAIGESPNNSNKKFLSVLSGKLDEKLIKLLSEKDNISNFKNWKNQLTKKYKFNHRYKF